MEGNDKRMVDADLAAHGGVDGAGMFAGVVEALSR